MTEWAPWLAVAAIAGVLVLALLLAWAFARIRHAEAVAQDALDRAGKVDNHVNSLHKILELSVEARLHPTDAMHQAIQMLDERLAALERLGSLPLPWPAAHRPEPLRPAHVAVAALVGGDAGQLTTQAAMALRSPDSFHAFARAVSGSGLLLRKDGSGTDPAPSADAAELWQVPHDGAFLVFPGLALARQQSLLLGDAGRAAHDRLGWLFNIQEGDQFKAAIPAKLAGDGTVLERGVLVLPG